MSKVIFLDIDGVLNNKEVFCKITQSRVWDNWCVDRLNKITKETNAKIVISSTWRRSDSLYSIIKNEMGIEGEIIGRTINYLPIGVERTYRGDEIQLWLDEHPFVTNFIILDDNSDMVHLIDHLIQTDTFIGLTDEHVKEAIRRLNFETYMLRLWTVELNLNKMADSDEINSTDHGKLHTMADELGKVRKDLKQPKVKTSFWKRLIGK